MVDLHSIMGIHLNAQNLDKVIMYIYMYLIYVHIHISNWDQILSYECINLENEEQNQGIVFYFFKKLLTIRIDVQFIQFTLNYNG
jgi:hypothetical protein